MKHNREIHRKKRRLRSVYILITAGMLLALAIFLFQSLFTIKEILLEDGVHFSREFVISKLISNETDNISVLCYINSKIRPKKTIPFVESYDVEYVNRNTIKINIYEKLVIGCVKVMGAYMYFDKDGIIVESTQERFADVPLVQGLEYSQVVLYEPLKVQRSSYFDKILELTKLVKLNELSVDQIIFNSDMEVSLICEGNQVLCGRRDHYDVQIAALKSILISAKDEKYLFDLRNYSSDHTEVVAKRLE